MLELQALCITHIQAVVAVAGAGHAAPAAEQDRPLWRRTKTEGLLSAPTHGSRPAGAAMDPSLVAALEVAMAALAQVRTCCRQGRPGCWRHARACNPALAVTAACACLQGRGSAEWHAGVWCKLATSVALDRHLLVGAASSSLLGLLVQQASIVAGSGGDAKQQVGSWLMAVLLFSQARSNAMSGPAPHAPPSMPPLHAGPGAHQRPVQGSHSAG